MTATFGCCGFVVVVCGIARSRWFFWFSVLLRVVCAVCCCLGFGLGVLGLGGNFCGFRFVGFVGVGLLLWGLAVLVVFAVVLVFSFVLILSVLSGFLCGLAHCILLVGLVGFSVYCACGCLCVLTAFVAC